MASWQEGNGGALLAGIGRVNDNAPQASDINPTLGLIRENNDLARSGANNVALTGLRGVADIAGMYQQEQQQKAQDAFNQAHANAWQSGDVSSLRDFAAANPAFVAQAQQAVAGLNDQQKSDIGTQAAGLRMALAQGPGAFSSYVSDNAQSLSRIGADPRTILQMGMQSPEQAQHLVDTIGMASLGGKDYFDTIDKQQGRQIDRGRLDETIRSNQASEANTIRGQNLTYQSAMTGHSIAQQNVNLRRMELDDKKYDRQIARETNDLKLADLQDKRAKNQQDIEQARRDKSDAYNTSMDAMSRTVETAQKVLDSPGFNGYFGVNLNPLSNRFIPGTDAADTSALVDTLKSQGFMSGIQQMRGLGALSNAEGQKVMDAIGNLSASQSEASAKASIKAIISTTQKAQERLQQKYGKDIPPIQDAQQAPAATTQQTTSGYQSLWGD